MYKEIQIILFVTISAVFDTGYAQIGTDCKIDKDCNMHQSCSLGYCKCDIGYIKNIHHCFKIRKYQQECFYSFQCVDHRMACRPRDSDPQQIPRCLCDSYHEWNATKAECIQVKNISQVVSDLGEEYERGQLIEADAQKVFFWLVIAGLTVVSIILSFILICLCYGCCCREKKVRTSDSDDRNADIKEVAVVGLPQGTYSPLSTELSLT